MRKLTFLFAATLAVAASFAVPQTVEAQSRIRCESRDNRRQTCEIPGLDQQSVRMVNRLSQSPCVNGRSWGTDGSGIWVTQGCRAEFEYSQQGGGGIRELTCESSNNQLENCRVPGLDQQSVRLVRRLSQSACVNGQSWGTMVDVIWVESGCRAVFEYQAGRAQNRGRRSQADMGGDRMTVRCESQNNRRQVCNIRNLDLGSVQLEDNLSRTPCNLDQNWGTQRGQIWVSGGCRAVFSYRVNNEA